MMARANSLFGRLVRTSRLTPFSSRRRWHSVMMSVECGGCNDEYSLLTVAQFRKVHW